MQGTSSDQDARFYNKEKKLKKSLKYPPNIGIKVRFGECLCIGLILDLVLMKAQ